MGYTVDEAVACLDGNMPSLSPTASKVMALANDMNCPPAELTKVIKLDPVLSARVLKLVNSPYFGIGKSIISLEKAIIMLGLNTIKNLALSAAVLTQMEAGSGRHAFDAEEFWKHSLGVGAAAKMIARVRGIDKKRFEDFFIAGLLHDLGLLAEGLVYPDEMVQVIERAGRTSLVDAEEELLDGVGHCVVGKLMADRWHLSLDLAKVMAFHHSPHLEGAETELNLTIYLANIICKNHGVGLVLERTPIEVDSIAYEALGVDASIADEIAPALGTEIDRAKEFLSA